MDRARVVYNKPSTKEHRPKAYKNALTRWASVGPYYAMFPVNFAFDVVRKYSKAGQSVLDPFAGRGSSIFAAGALGRIGVGIEINPVGWLYSNVKLGAAPKDKVINRLKDICEIADIDTKCIRALPAFFHSAYAEDTLRFLVAAREHLNWKQNRVDSTLMVFILVYLHGKLGSALSNQMRDGKSMAPEYAIRWWAERSLIPPQIDLSDFLTKRIEWRYKHGTPELAGRVYLGDSTKLLGRLAHEIKEKKRKNFSLLFTSPPYMGVTNYHYDQWLRLWMLGGASLPHSTGGKWQKRFGSKSDYTDLLGIVFDKAARTMSKEATVYVRTDAREFTLETTKAVLKEIFPKKRMYVTRRPLSLPSQTALFGDKSHKPGEVDLIMIG